MSEHSVNASVNASSRTRPVDPPHRKRALSPLCQLVLSYYIILYIISYILYYYIFYGRRFNSYSLVNSLCIYGGGSRKEQIGAVEKGVEIVIGKESEIVIISLVRYVYCTEIKCI